MRRWIAFSDGCYAPDIYEEREVEKAVYSIARTNQDGVLYTQVTDNGNGILIKDRGADGKYRDVKLDYDTAVTLLNVLKMVDDPAVEPDAIYELKEVKG